MHTITLRKVGGSIMLAVPPSILDLLNLQAGSPVGVRVDGNMLVIEPHPSPRYSLDELLAQCDGSANMTEEDQEWLETKPVGNL